ncbi:alpha-L-arabinofuranosidase C-terminal domain-containing protein [Labilibaculum euxinus]|uniref:non-reducing end alpha-L-arabinofuranosidase n=1 Tax=Labilibaculum euxinus TaxID=2686357 RepID=A0A7M4D282_9BACT|nr:alpha-L-arabinofuranosidase C-terminal domain-containing protein [Labilibaculum euxinus]MUP36761.1 alpha-L-arabinofuranosidase [Labilibaculum euxinus]MVB05966.1 alpha-L-arabinofuranosidase [Labilibaculum euxinus]
MKLKKQIKRPLIFISLFILPCFSIFAQNNFVIDVKNVGAEIQPEMYGVFFEDINFGADGGLYAELIKNRSFEFEHPFLGWTPFGDVKVQQESPCFDKNPNYVRFNEKGLRTGTGLENKGFTGIGFHQYDEYLFSFYARSISNDENKFKVELLNAGNAAIGTSEILVQGNAWKKYTCTIKAKETEAKGKIRFILETAGTVDVDHISLFPKETWKGRKNGLRKDLAQALYDLHPGVLRFPGGCIVEGNTLKTRYQWKNSVGPAENRPLNINRWFYTFKYHFFPDYYQSYGLGFFEYFLLSEDIGAEPLPVLSCGLACQYESKECVAVDSLDSYIQDAVDLIEFANGKVSTKWGKVRAEMGHPEPFNLKMIAIGNEQWGDVYVERLEKFVKVIREKHPEIKIVGGSGPSSDGKQFEYLWPKMKELKVDLVDEHYYKNPEWFYKNAKRYDTYDRKGPKVFAGEYAAHDTDKANNLRAALAEAAFMTGLERNADVVHMATYAPLFAHVDAWQWRPDMIWFDNLTSVCTPNYYVQKMYAKNAGTNVLSIKSKDENITGQDSLYASAVLDHENSEIIVKVVNISSVNHEINIKLDGLKKSFEDKEVKITCLHSNNPDSQNTLAAPLAIVPGNYSISSEKNSFKLSVTGNAFYVCRLKIKQ